MSSAASRWDRCCARQQYDFAAKGLRLRVEALGSAAKQNSLKGRSNGHCGTEELFGRIGLRKSVAQIQEETRTSELKRTLGPVEPRLPRHRLHHRRRHLRPHRQCRRASRRTGRSDLLRHCRHRLRLCRPLLRRAGLDPAGFRIGLHLQLRHDRRVRRLGHGRAAAARIWACRFGRRGRLVRLCGQPARRLRASHTGRPDRADRAPSAEGWLDVLVNGAPVVYLFNLPAFLVCSALADPAGDRRVGIRPSSTTSSSPSR